MKDQYENLRNRSNSRLLEDALRRAFRSACPENDKFENLLSRLEQLESAGNDRGSSKD